MVNTYSANLQGITLQSVTHELEIDNLDCDSPNATIKFHFIKPAGAPLETGEVKACVQATIELQARLRAEHLDGKRDVDPYIKRLLDDTFGPGRLER